MKRIILFLGIAGYLTAGSTRAILVNGKMRILPSANGTNP